MRYISARLLLDLGGNKNPEPQDFEAFFNEIEMDFERGQVHRVVDALRLKNLSDIINEGRAKLANVSTGGAPSTSSAPRDIAADNQPAETKEEPKEESDDDMGFGLFD